MTHSLDDLGARIVAALGEPAARELLHVLTHTLLPDPLHVGSAIHLILSAFFRAAMSCAARLSRPKLLALVWRSPSAYSS